MARRLFLVFPAFFASIKPAAVRPNENIVDAWNDVAIAANSWVPLAQEYVNSPGESPVQMQRKWEAVRKAFRTIDIIVRNE